MNNSKLFVFYKGDSHIHIHWNFYSALYQNSLTKPAPSAGPFIVAQSKVSTPVSRLTQLSNIAKFSLSQALLGSRALFSINNSTSNVLYMGDSINLVCR